MAKAIVIIKSGNEWWDDVALNYSQLSIDHSVSSRYSRSSYSYHVVDKFNGEHYVDYDCVLVIPAGTMLIWGNYEKNVELKLKNYETVYIGKGAFVWQPMGDSTIDLKMNIQSVDPSSAETFMGSHSGAVTNLIDDSNISYRL